MPAIQVRSATPADLATLKTFDHSYSTDSVWQMDLHEDSTVGQISATFLAVRLPRPMRVVITREAADWERIWQKRLGCLVAEEAGTLKGYMSLSPAPSPDAVWLADYAVERRFRRQGVGRVLITAAMQWARQNHFRYFVLETQSKNHPAISFAQKHGLAFCGYHDRYYANQDVALFFGAALK